MTTFLSTAIEHWPVERLIPYDRNARTHSEEQIEQIVQAIRNSSRSGDLGLDPFGGSGSTLIACEKNGRLARLVEIDPIYVDVTIHRWQKFTGNQAVLSGDGRAFAESRPGVETKLSPDPESGLKVRA